MSKVKDETGNIYGKLTVLERAGSNSCGKATWLCQCECGKNYYRSWGCFTKRNGFYLWR